MNDIQGDSIKEAWVLSLILGFIMINFPFIHIFNSIEPIFGIPKLVLYFFIGWPISIAVICFFTHQSKKNVPENYTPGEDTHKP